ncbi:MAG: hypothetical protein J6W23_03605, partial [Victivallales bacterium]|nr:hypothetical protein [Victivallales bacterium]
MKLWLMACEEAQVSSQEIIASDEIKATDVPDVLREMIYAQIIQKLRYNPLLPVPKELLTVLFKQAEGLSKEDRRYL